MIVGFSFTKMSAEKKGAAKGKIDINNNVSMKNVEGADISLGKDKQNAAKFIFEFTSRYEPGVGLILMEGELLYLEDAKKINDIIASWKKDKKLPKDLMTNLLNTILTKCNLQALILSKEINLPPPIPMPKVQVASGGEKNYIG